MTHDEIQALEGAELDAEVIRLEKLPHPTFAGKPWPVSTSWDFCGPIIDREGISVAAMDRYTGKGEPLDRTSRRTLPGEIAPIAYCTPD